MLPGWSQSLSWFYTLLPQSPPVPVPVLVLLYPEMADFRKHALSLVPSVYSFKQAENKCYLPLKKVELAISISLPVTDWKDTQTWQHTPFLI